MNPPKVTDEDYVQFLIATSKVCSATVAERAQSDENQALAHDTFTHLLHRLEPDALMLWREAAPYVKRQRIIVRSSSTVVSSRIKSASPALNATTSVSRYAPSCAWNGIATKPASVGWRQSSLSSAPAFGPTWLIHFITCPQLRNS